MFKKIAFLLCSFAMIPALASSEKEKNIKASNLKPWLQAPEVIAYVKTMKGCSSLPCNDATTVLAVKNSLNENEGIPVAAQRMYPLHIPWWGLGLLERHGPLLADGTKIKHAMNEHNTDLFALYLQLPKKSSSSMNPEDK